MKNPRDFALSGEQVQKIAGYPIQIITYKDLLQYDNIEDLLNSDLHKSVMILHEFEPNVGHWILLTYLPNENMLELFDPFGNEPDDFLDWSKVPKSTKKELGEDKRYLSYLLAKTKLPISYNEFEIQHKDSSVCGRYTAWRVRNRNKNLYKFVEPFIQWAKKGQNPDDLIIKLTDKYL